MICPNCGNEIIREGVSSLWRCNRCFYIADSSPVIERVEIQAAHEGEYGVVGEIRPDVPVLHRQILKASEHLASAMQYDVTPLPKSPKMSFDNLKFADAVKQRRGDMGLRQLAGEIGGVSASTLSRIENGKTPDMETFLAVCTWLNMSPVEFIAGASGNVGDDGEEHDVILTIRLDSRSKIWLVGDPPVTLSKVGQSDRPRIGKTQMIFTRSEDEKRD